jgi:CBS domain-containing protein
MKLKEIMTREVEIVQPNDSLLTAAKKMRDRDIGFLPVYEGDQLIGVLTDRDLILRALAEGMNAASTIGRDLVTAPAMFCYEDQEVEEAARLMEYNRIRRLVVLNRRDHRLVGVVSLGDLAGIVDDKIAGNILESVSTPVKSL